jgi:hypothetical protein
VNAAIGIKFKRRGHDKAWGVGFGCNGRGTREKTQASEEKVVEEYTEKERSLVTRVDWFSRKNPKVKINQVFSKILSKMRLNRYLLGVWLASAVVTLAV